MTEPIRLRGAREHNLKHLDLEFPRAQLTVVAGVSGSGKSSLAFDTLYREAQRRFFSMLPGYRRTFGSGLRRPALEGAEGLGPGVAVDQRSGMAHPRSTVGTRTELWDLLRLLYARAGQAPEGIHLNRGLFSFSGPGACPTCQGLGVEDRLDPGALVAHPDRSLRGGALAVTTPFAGGYLMYSQVTLTALDALLHVHGGDVDTPWQELTEEVRQVVLHGSERLAIPLGKHTLETRLKWKGITARPQPEGFYRGLVPVMEEILRTKRNDGILRFARTRPCEACGGSRLGPEARAVRVGGMDITALGFRTPREVAEWLEGLTLEGSAEAVRQAVSEAFRRRTRGLEDLGLGHLSLDRPTASLGPGEVRRLRLLGLAQGELRELLVVLDEPSAGLHPSEVPGLVRVLRGMTERGQTVVVVDHDPQVFAAADHRILLGPVGGAQGGYRVEALPLPAPRVRPPLRTGPTLAVPGLDQPLIRGGLHVLTGPSGAGKRMLLHRLAAALAPHFPRRLEVDDQPIGRSPRSCIATYTGAMDLLRDRYAASPEATQVGLGRSAFSFNTEGGRCEACQGAGIREVGLHHLGAVEVTCEACDGRRFRDEVLKVKVDGLDLAAFLNLEIGQALSRSEGRLRTLLEALVELGLGHLTLGHRAPDLSGGEAQRVKLATELVRAGSGEALVVLEGPMTGLHAVDADVLLGALLRLRNEGHTLLVVEHHRDLLRGADQVLELDRGQVVFQGTAEALARTEMPTGRWLAAADPAPGRVCSPPSEAVPMVLEGVHTHTLKGIDVTFPVPGLTVVTGPSGSGKSSLVFDTLAAEAQARFAELLSPWARRLVARGGGAELEAAHDLRAALALPAGPPVRNPRSTVGTVSGLDAALRLLFSRAGTRPDGHPTALTASAFSPHTHAGACPTCGGLGFLQEVQGEALVQAPSRSLEEGALGGARYLDHLMEPGGRHLATLVAAAQARGLSLEGPWEGLSPEARALVLDGAGPEAFAVTWAYRRGNRTGTHAFEAPWEGLRALVRQERERLAGDPKGADLEAFVVDLPCEACGGLRLGPQAREIRLEGLSVPEAQGLTLDALETWSGQLPQSVAHGREALQAGLRALQEAGLGYLSLGRLTSTLSGGEAQRLRLATTLVEGLTGVAYLLDEPTQGLHPRDRARLLGVLRRLAAAGNAVVVVEHDLDLIRGADHVILLGPGAGPQGGEVVAAGPPAKVAAHLPLGRRLTRRVRTGRSGIALRGASRRNLQDLDLRFPAGVLCVIEGPSGSGKSTLLHDVLGASLRAGRPMGCREAEGLADFREVISLAQGGQAWGRGSTVASLLGLADGLRKRFAACPEARRLGLTARSFSTAHPGGRCEVCEGRGSVAVALDLMADLTLACEACDGSGFGPEVRAVHLEGLTLPGLMTLDVASAAHRLPFLRRPLEPLLALGLGYLALGRGGETLSEGERQRLQLVRLVGDPGAQPVAVLLDEPTRGLGAGELEGLLGVLDRLAEAGHLVVAVSHHAALCEAADWTLTLGPGGGPEGGRLMGQGPRR